MRVLKTLEFEIPGVPQQKRSGTPMATYQRVEIGGEEFVVEKSIRKFMVANPLNKKHTKVIRQYAWAAGWRGPLHLGPVRLYVTAYFPFLKSWAKFIREGAEGQPHTSKPDGDRILNLIQDALQGKDWIWKDDSQVYAPTPRKLYSARPRTEIRIELLEDWQEALRRERSERRADKQGGDNQENLNL